MKMGDADIFTDIMKLIKEAPVPWDSGFRDVSHAEMVEAGRYQAWDKWATEYTEWYATMEAALQRLFAEKTIDEVIAAITSADLTPTQKAFLQHWVTKLGVQEPGQVPGGTYEMGQVPDGTYDMGLRF